MQQLVVGGLIALFAPLVSATALQQWESPRSRTDARLRGISAVSGEVAWASGARGTVLRTVDGGRVWQPVPVPGASLSIGSGAASRIYKTTDGGQTWTLQFQNADPDAFFDAMAFWDERRGIAFSDSVGGRFVVIRTTDGGTTWSRIPPESLPPALENEGAFAASGTNAGGDYSNETHVVDNAATTSDGGKTWMPATGLSGYRSAVAYLGGGRGVHIWVAAGPSGADLSRDDGRTWKKRMQR